MKFMKTVTADPWSISAEDFPANGTTAEKWKFFLRYAVLAPSSHNSQPWLFHLRHNTLELYADRRRACPIVDPNDRELIMSCACALFHLRCAMRHFGYLGTVEIFPDRDPDFVARVGLGTQKDSCVEESILFYAIPKRRTNRQPFTGDPVPDSLLVALQEAAEAGSDEVERLLLPIEAALNELAALAVGQNDAARLLRGQAVLIRGRDAPMGGGATYATCKGHLIAVGHVEKGELKPTRVFNFSEGS